MMVRELGQLSMRQGQLNAATAAGHDVGFEGGSTAAPAGAAQQRFNFPLSFNVSLNQALPPAGISIYSLRWKDGSLELQ